MTLTYRSVFSACAAVGIAVAGVAANSADAYFKTVSLSPATADQVSIQTPVVTFQNRAPETGYTMGIGLLGRNSEPGRDSLMVMAGDVSSAANLPATGWTCRARLFNGFRVVKSTSTAHGSRLPITDSSGMTAFTPDASGPYNTYPRVAATQLRADCN
jgi:hypothetical protein